MKKEGGLVCEKQQRVKQTLKEMVWVLLFFTSCLLTIVSIWFIVIGVIFVIPNGDWSPLEVITAASLLLFIVLAWFFTQAHYINGEYEKIVKKGLK